MRKIVKALFWIAVVVGCAACNPYTYAGNASANAGTGSGTGGFCGGAVGVASK